MKQKKEQTTGVGNEIIRSSNNEVSMWSFFGGLDLPHSQLILTDIGH